MRHLVFPVCAAALAALFAVFVLPSGASAQTLSAGIFHTCAVTSSGSVVCWGDNTFGQLGDGTPDRRSTPAGVAGLASGVVSVSAGSYHTCALTSAGGVKCWGNNSSGELGNNSTASSNVPVDVVGLSSGVASVSAGWQHTCALLSSGGLKCWGGNTYGELGNGMAGGRRTPTDVVGLTAGVRSMSAGYGHTCAVVASGGAKCWGWNEAGKLGYGAMAGDRTTPVDVSGMASGVGSIASGGYHTCALTTAGDLKCWGHNFYGQLGDGAGTTRSTVPVDVSGMASGVSSMAVGTNHTCATLAGGLWCWGNNEQGQLGDGTTTKRPTPTGVAGLGLGVQSVAGGGSHTCAATTSGGVKCWGSNSHGQLGDGTRVDRPRPVDVLGLTVGVANAPEDAPAPGALVAVHPNPTRGPATVRFTLAAPGEASLSVYDVLGRRVATLARGPQSSGEHVATWNPENLPGGLYVVRLQSAGGVSTQILRLVR